MASERMSLQNYFGICMNSLKCANRSEKNCVNKSAACVGLWMEVGQRRRRRIYIRPARIIYIMAESNANNDPEILIFRGVLGCHLRSPLAVHRATARALNY